MNATRCAISPEMNTTSRKRRSSLATPTGQPRRFAFAGGGGELRLAIERVGPFSRFEFDELADDFERVGFGEGFHGDRCASMPSPLLPCLAVETRR